MQTRSQQILIALQTILTREIVRFLRIWSQTLLPPVITMSLYYLIFGKLIGSQINRIDGYSYMQYIVPGLVMMAIITNAYANTATSFFGAKFSKSIEEILVSPVPNSIILIGYTLGGVLRGLVVGVLVIIVSLFFTHLTIHSWVLTFTTAVLAAAVFSLAGLINGILAKKFDDVSFIPTFVLMPLTYLGGVFYSIKQLPDVWRKISIFNPILEIVDTFRFGILGISDVNIYFALTMIAVLLLVLIMTTLELLRRGTGLRT